MFFNNLEEAQQCKYHESALLSMMGNLRVVIAKSIVQMFLRFKQKKILWIGFWLAFNGIERHKHAKLIFL